MWTRALVCGALTAALLLVVDGAAGPSVCMSEAVCPILSGTDGCGPVPQVCDDPGPSLATVLLVSLLVALVGLAASAPRRRHDRAAHAPERQHDP